MLNAGMSMFTNIASQAKTVLGGVASQVANSMPTAQQLNPQGNPPPQFRAPNQNQAELNSNQRRAAAPEAQK